MSTQTSMQTMYTALGYNSSSRLTMSNFLNFTKSQSFIMFYIQSMFVHIKFIENWRLHSVLAITYYFFSCKVICAFVAIYLFTFIITTYRFNVIHILSIVWHLLNIHHLLVTLYMALQNQYDFSIHICHLSFVQHSQSGNNTHNLFS